MIFGVLGPLLVEDSQGPRLLAAPKQRVLLASLLLRPNQVVPVSELLDRLWGESHPVSALAAVHNHMARLRRSLGAEAGARIRTRSPGYLAEIRDDEELDLARFHSLHTAAAAEAEHGAYDRAAAMLRQALGLWRGNALSDVPATTVRSRDGEQLDELRLVVWQQRIEYDLERGAGEALLPELRELLAAHPFQEGLYGQLMRALYQAGRQADALGVFRAARTTLLDELGVEPGPALQQVHESLLQQDPDLTQVRAARLRPPQSRRRDEPMRVPVQLPPGVPDFTGRLDECAALAAVLATDSGHGPLIVAISGQAGIGKTELALQAAWQVRDAFPDGVLFADLQGQQSRPADPADVLAAFARALGTEGMAIPAERDARAALYRSLTAGRRLLVVLDNAADSAQVRPLLPGPGSAALVTNRRRLTGLAGAHAFDLGILSATEAAALFRTVAGRGHAEPDAVAAIAARCGYLPLALRISGARLAARPAWTMREIAERLADSCHRLDELRTEDMDVRASLMLSYAALPEPNARAFRLLALSDAPTVPLPIAAAMLDLPLRVSEQVLEDLVDAHLLTCPRQGSYGFHDLPRLFGKERADDAETAEDQLAALRRGAGAVLLLLDRVSPGSRLRMRSGTPFVGEPRLPDSEGQRWTADELENMCTWIRQLLGTEGLPVTLSSDLLEAMSPSLIVGGFWTDLDSCAHAVLATALEQADEQAQSSAHRAIGTVATFRQDVSTGRDHLEQALACAERAHDDYCVANAALILGRLLGDTGEHPAAIAALTRSARIYGEADLDYKLGTALNYLGKEYLATGDTDAALARLQEGLELSLKIGDERLEAMSRYLLGTAYLAAGDTQSAIGFGQQAVSLARANQSVLGEAHACLYLGRSLRLARRHREAAAQFDQAAALFDRLGDKSGAEIARSS